MAADEVCKLVESTTDAVTVASRWVVGGAFAPPPQSGLTWLRFLSPLIEPDVRHYRIRRVNGDDGPYGLARCGVVVLGAGSGWGLADRIRLYRWGLTDGQRAAGNPWSHWWR